MAPSITHYEYRVWEEVLPLCLPSIAAAP